VYSVLGLIPVVTKSILGELNNLQMLFSSTLFSCMVMGGMVLFQKKASVLDVSELRPQEATKRVGHFCPYPLGHQHQSRKRIQSLTNHLALVQQGTRLFHGGADPKELAHFLEGTAEA
jgi:hypothetical protein